MTNNVDGMRVLHVVATGQRRGAEMFASDLVRALGEDGPTQRVALLRGSGGPAVGYEAPTVVLPSDGWRMPGLRIDALTLRALRALIAQWRPTVLQAHGGEPLKYSVLAAVGHRAPIVYRRIGSVTPVTRTGLRRVAHGRLIRRAARVVAVADVVRRELLETFGVSPSRVVTIPRGIDPGRLEPRQGRAASRRALRIPPTVPVILSLGALTWEKDPEAQLDVTSRVLARYPEAVHLLVGEGPLRGDVENSVRRRGLADRVRVLGSRSDVADLLAASDLLLLASKTEGMPGCLIEAGMTGVPVAAYAVGGVPEVVLDGETGLLASPQDLRALTDSVLRLLGDRAAGRAMGRRARTHCRSRFAIQVVAPQYLDLYRDVTGVS